LSPLPFSLLSLKNSRQHVYVRACNNILKTATGEITHAIVGFFGRVEKHSVINLVLGQIFNFTNKTNKYWNLSNKANFTRHKPCKLKR
jgi:hypothetical protein